MFERETAQRRKNPPITVRHDRKYRKISYLVMLRTVERGMGSKNTEIEPLLEGHPLPMPTKFGRHPSVQLLLLSLADELKLLIREILSCGQTDTRHTHSTEARR